MPIDTAELKDITLDMVGSVSFNDAEIADAVGELKDFFERHDDALVEAGVDFAIEVVARAMVGKPDMKVFTTSLEALSAEELVALAEADAVASEQLASGILDRRKALLDDLVATLGRVARAALAAGIAALRGLAK